MTEVLYALDAAERERIAALRAEGRFFWLDVSLRETSRDDLVEALGVPEHALRVLTGSGDALASRRSHADRNSVVFTSVAMSSRRRQPMRRRIGGDPSKSVSW